MTSFAVVIPARLSSTRLNRKPLVDIAGKPMIIHTWERACEAADPSDVFVATDSEEIVGICDAYGAQSVMTPADCLTGTDRVAIFAREVKRDVYINVQGDEPMMPAPSISKVIDLSCAHPNDIINGWAHIESEREYRSRTVPKVVLRADGRLLYMSRSPVPGTKDDTFQFSRKQICVYSFPAAALEAFVAQESKTPHEAAEDIEILRFLELGWEVRMVELSGDSIAVDTFDDLERVRAAIELG